MSEISGGWSPRHAVKLPANDGLRVLYVNHTLLPSGAAISLGTLIRALGGRLRPYFLLRAGNRVGQLLGATPERTYHERLMPHANVTVYSKPLPWSLYLWQLAKAPIALWRLWSLSCRWRPDLIHLNETTLVFYGLAARLLRLPVVIHARTVLGGGRRLDGFLLRVVARGPRARVVCVDEEVFKSLAPDLREEAVVVHNPIDLGEAPDVDDVAALRASWGAGPDDIIVGQVASLHAEKGVWQVLDVAEGLGGRSPAVRLVLVGDAGPEAGVGPALEEAIERRGLSSHVVLAGYHDRLSLVYSAFDIVICLFGAGLAGIGRTAYEGALAGKPVVATVPNPADSTTFRDRVSILLYESADLEGVAGAIKSLCEDPGLRERLGAEGQRLIASRQSPQVVAAQISEIYHQLLASRE